jgi:calcium/calmodulin-dependent protein kinase (CaM kinase) II
MPDAADLEAELLDANRRLLDAIAGGDWAGYAELCADSLTAFEEESRGQLVAGLDFHRFYFELPAIERAESVARTEMIAPHVRPLGTDAGVVSYVRLVQSVDVDGTPVTSRSEETRVWQRVDGRWQHVHFHRSSSG